MKKAGIKPDVSTYNEMMINVINASCCKTKSLEPARVYFDEMKEAGIKPDVASYNSMISICNKTENHEAVRAYFEEMKDARITGDVFVLKSDDQHLQQDAEPR